MVNLRDNCPYGLNSDSFFPRSYEISNDKDKWEFIKEYQNNQLLILLKKHVSYFKKMRQEFIKKIKNNIQEKKLFKNKELWKK